MTSPPCNTGVLRHGQLLLGLYLSSLLDHCQALASETSECFYKQAILKPSSFFLSVVLENSPLCMFSLFFFFFFTLSFSYLSVIRVPSPQQHPWLFSPTNQLFALPTFRESSFLFVDMQLCSLILLLTLLCIQNHFIFI